MESGNNLPIEKLESVEYGKTFLNNVIEIENIISIHYFEYDKGFAYPGEFHDFWEIVYADKEELVITAGTHELLLSPGQMFLHRPLEFHNLRCNKQKAANSFIITFSSSCQELYSIAGKVYPCPKHLIGKIAAIVQEARNAFSNPLGEVHTFQLTRREDPVFGAEQLIRIYLEELLIHWIRETFAEQRQRDFIADYETNNRLSEICKYIESQVEHNLSFSQLCQHFSMSESSMKKIFRNEIGKGAMEYYNHCKIEKAKQMIREQGKNFTEIAYRLGYHSVQYFSRHFRNATGMTPSQYAKSIKKLLK